MNGRQWMAVLALAMLPIPICEVAKAVAPRNRAKGVREAATTTQAAEETAAK